MQKDEFITRMVKEGLGNCPSMSTILIFSRNEKVGQEDSEHIELCPICQKKLKIINEDENLRDLEPSFFEVDAIALGEIKELIKKKKTEQLLDKENLERKMHYFRKRLCHYVGEEYLKNQTQLKPGLHKTRIDDILSRLESTYKPYKPEPLIDMQSLQFSPEELQPNTLSTYVIISFLLTSLSIASEDFHLDLVKLFKKFSKSVALLEQQGLFDERDLHRTKAIIEGFLFTKGI